MPAVKILFYQHFEEPRLSDSFFVKIRLFPPASRQHTSTILVRHQRQSGAGGQEGLKYPRRGGSMVWPRLRLRYR